MGSLRSQIDDFETRYLSRIRDWSAYLPPEDLDTVIETISRLQADSQAISNQFSKAQETLYQTRWVPLLQMIEILVSPLTGQLEKIKDETQTSLGLLDKGQRGLRGYRQNMGDRRSFFESEG